MIIPVILVLDRALRDAGIPIDGVSLGDPLVRSTWKAFYQASATASQRTQGDQLLATIDPQDATTIANIKADLAVGLADADLIKAVTLALWENTPAPVYTKVQLRARILAILKTF